MASEVRPPILDRNSSPPNVFDGTTRLYICYKCPYSHRVWLLRNYKGLQDKIELVAIDSWNRPSWYKQKVYEYDKVPCLEYNNQIMGDSLDLLNYIEAHFPGPSLAIKSPSKKKFGDELMFNSDDFMKNIHMSFRGDPKDETSNSFDYLDVYCLKRYNEGPFMLGELSLVDFAYAPFIDRFHTFLKEQFNFDIVQGRPRLAQWLEEMNKMDCFKETKCDPEVVVRTYRSRYITLKF